MTTRINVNVDQQALLQRSREQTQSNRWAFLEGQNRSKVGKEAERQRDANRAARGLTADGSMYNNRLRQLPQRPDPAAWRTGKQLGYFWLRQTTQSANGMTYRKLVVTSGDGSKTAEATLTNPTVFSYLNATRPAMPASGFEYATNYYSNTLALINSPYYAYPLKFPNSARDYRETTADLSTTCLTDASVSLTAPDGFVVNVSARHNSRKIFAVYDVSNSRERSLALPLGKDVALVAWYYAGAAHHRYLTITETTTSTPAAVSNSPRTITTNVTRSYTSTVQKLSPTQFEECICFLVSRTRAEKIEPPPLIVQQFRSLVGTPATKTETAYFEAALGCSTLDFNGQYQETFSYSGYPTFTSPATGASTRGNTFTYDDIYFERSGALEAADSNSTLNYGAYGLLYKGSVDSTTVGATPLSWFHLDSRNAGASIANATTHQALRAVSSAGITGTVGDKLSYKKYLGLPYYPSIMGAKVLEGDQKAFKANGGSFNGSLSDENYQYGNSPWLSATLLIKQAQSQPSGSPQLYFVYDWGNAGFCREQATRYGISV